MLDPLLLDVVIPPEVQVPLWITSIGIVGNAIVMIAKPFIPVLQERQKQGRKLLEARIAELEEKLSNCERDTDVNTKAYETLKGEMGVLENKYTNLVTKIAFLRRLEEGSKIDDLLGKIQEDGSQ